MSFSSLEGLCLQQIAKDIKIWCDDREDFTQYLYLLGPFEGLGSRQIQQLLNILVKTKQLKASHLQVLLHAGVTVLNLSVCTFLVTDSIVKTIAKRCKNLTCLSLKNCTRLSPKTLQELPSTLTNLQTLDVSGCSACCTNDLLYNLGEHCKNLQVLKLESCLKVTDNGLRGLCGDKENPKCSKIVDLDLSSTSVSSEGVYLVLITQPELRSLSLCATYHSEQSQYFNDSYLSLRTTRLNFLDVSHTSVDDSVIANICHVCPQLCSFNLNGCQHPTSMCLSHIKTLHNLRHLQLDILYILDFENDLIPFLRDCGSRLETLHISRSYNIDTHVFGKYCHSLTSLSLTESYNLTASFVEVNNSSKSLTESCPLLKCLNLQDCKFSDALSLSEHLEAIFSHFPTSLEVLNLSGVKHLRCDCVLPFIQSSGFSKLKSLDLSRCKRVCGEMVCSFVESCQALTYLDLNGCWEVSCQDTEKAKKLAKELGRNLEIVWS